MASTELETIKSMLMQGKMQTQAGTYMPAEAVAEARAGNDAIIGGMLESTDLYEGVRIEEGELAGTPGEWCRVAASPTKRVLLYFHGGGYENGTVKSRRLASVGIAKAMGADSFSLDYTQWPEGKHPVALNQAVPAFRELAGRYGAANVVMAGDSAGAMLALAAIHWLRAHDEETPARLACIGPVLDMAEELPSRTANEAIDPMFHNDLDQQMLTRYFEGADPRSPYVSARYGSYDGFPPTMVTVGTDEILYDDARILHELLDEAGVENVFDVCDGGYHTYQLMPCPEGMESLAKIGEFLSK